MMIRSFDPETLRPAHEGTILAHGGLGGDEIGAPFGSAFGVLRPSMAQKPEKSPVAKLYYMRCGEAVMTIEDETRVICEGDVLYIPANAWHTITNEGHEDVGTFAIWWEPTEGQTDA